MKTINNFLNEVRNKASYGQKATMICTEDELDQLSDIIRAGAKAMKFDLKSEENQYSLTVSFLDMIETMGGMEDDEAKIVLFKKQEEKEDDK